VRRGDQWERSPAAADHRHRSGRQRDRQPGPECPGRTGHPRRRPAAAPTDLRVRRRRRTDDPRLRDRAGPPIAHPPTEPDPRQPGRDLRPQRPRSGVSEERLLRQHAALPREAPQAQPLIPPVDPILQGILPDRVAVSPTGATDPRHRTLGRVDQLPTVPVRSGLLPRKLAASRRSADPVSAIGRRLSAVASGFESCPNGAADGRRCGTFRARSPDSSGPSRPG
jgi:hypothetical protein